MQSVRIITAGEDGWLKIWNSNIDLLQQIDVKQSCEI
jgi:hypothetical protein